MAVTEIMKSSAYRVYDAASAAWKKYSFWTRASDTVYADGQNAQTKNGAINGITSSLASTATDIAASASMVHALNSKLNNKFNITTDQYAAYPLEKAIGLMVDELFPGITEFVSCMLATQSGWYVIEARVSSSGTNTGKATGTAIQWASASPVYSFYRNEGADAVLKKLGDTAPATITITTAAGSGTPGLESDLSIVLTKGSNGIYSVTSAPTQLSVRDSSGAVIHGYECGATTVTQSN